MKNRLVHWFIISTFVGLYLIVSIISTIHVIEFFGLSNPRWLAISLALAFEVGAAASLSSLIIMEKMNKFMVWSLFIILTSMQAMGNTYYAYTHLANFQSWVELFGLIDEDVIYQKRILSIISGAILPLVSLGFIKSLVDYIKPDDRKNLDEGPSETISDEPSSASDFISDTYQTGFIEDNNMITEESTDSDSEISNVTETPVKEDNSISQQATSEFHMVNVNSNRPAKGDPIYEYKKRIRRQ